MDHQGSPKSRRRQRIPAWGALASRRSPVGASGGVEKAGARLVPAGGIRPGSSGNFMRGNVPALVAPGRRTRRLTDRRGNFNRHLRRMASPGDEGSFVALDPEETGLISEFLSDCLVSMFFSATFACNTQGLSPRRPALKHGPGKPDLGFSGSQSRRAIGSPLRDLFQQSASGNTTF